MMGSREIWRVQHAARFFPILEVHDMKSVVLAILVGVLSAPAFAQEQLFVPECEACPEFTTPPYPHSGWWSNPFESGTGINLDVQNGIAAGNLFVYKENGSPIWYQFSGRLEQTEDPDTYWTLTNDLYTFSGGQTLGGEYIYPDHDIAGTITVEFVRRSLLRFQVDDGPVRTMSPLMFGAASERFFEPESNIQAPSFKEGNPISQRREAPWIIVQMNPDGETGRYGFASMERRPHWGYSGSEPESGTRTSYGIDFWDYDVPPHMANSGGLSCGTGEQLADIYTLLPEAFSDEEHFCLMYIGDERMYYIRVGDITDRNFIGVSEDGWVVKGFRLLYN